MQAAIDDLEELIEHIEDVAGWFYIPNDVKERLLVTASFLKQRVTELQA